MGVFLVNLANFIFVLPAIPLLGYLGRKTLMMIMTSVMFASLLIMVIFTEWVVIGASNLIEIICVMVFVGGFEMSYGPILWLYLAEICTDKAISAAVFANWTSSVIVGQLTPYMLSNGWLGNYTFAVYGGLCAASTVFISIFMKETKGLTEQECKTLFSPKTNEYESDDEE
jgi:MFS family permease